MSTVILWGGLAPHQCLLEQFAWTQSQFVEKKVSTLSPYSFSEFISQSMMIMMHQQYQRMDLLLLMRVIILFSSIQQSLHLEYSLHCSSKTSMVSKMLKKRERLKWKLWLPQEMFSFSFVATILNTFVEIWYSEKRRSSLSLAWCDEYLKAHVSIYFKV